MVVSDREASAPNFGTQRYGRLKKELFQRGDYIWLYIGSFSLFFLGGGAEMKFRDHKFLQLSSRLFRELAVSLLTNVTGSRGVL
jgi:hypothetical protein